MSRNKSRVIFLLGAGRSGTTLLYKVLSLHKNIAYLSNYQKRYPRWPSLARLHLFSKTFPQLKRKTWFEEKGGAYFNEGRKWLRSVVPTPSEAESVYASCNMPLIPNENYFLPSQTAECLRNKFELIRQHSGGEVLLTKRTANNRRIPLLIKIFPEAKYIHLVRDGRASAYSSLRVSWWNDHVLYWSGKTPKQMIAMGFKPLELAAQNWVETMQSLEQGIALIQRDHLLDVRYNDLLRNPSKELQRILNFMEISEQSDGIFWNIVDSLHLAPKHEAWVYNWTETERSLVQDLQGETLRRWGFETESK